MSSSPQQGLPLSGRAFVGAVGLSGLSVVLYSLLVLTQNQPPLEWVAFSLLTFATGILTLKIPSIEMSFSMSEVFAFSCLLLYGPEMAVATVGDRRAVAVVAPPPFVASDGLQLRQPDALCLLRRDSSSSVPPTSRRSTPNHR